MSRLTNKNQLEASTSLPRFEHITRYWDKENQTASAKILPGEYYVTENDETVVTVLGSCISACIRDRVFGIGGMNHFMLPVANPSAVDNLSGQSASSATRYGSYAMEHLINDILKHGGRRENLEAKICGGGKIMAKMTDVGLKNIAFVKEYLETERIPIIGEDVGQIYPRKVQYAPKSGRLRIKKLNSVQTNRVIEIESGYQRSIDDKPVGGDIELF